MEVALSWNDKPQKMVKRNPTLYQTIIKQRFAVYNTDRNYINFKYMF